METNTPRVHWKRDITVFLISQNISLFGSSVVGFSIMWHITLETSSGFWMMLSTLCAVVPQILISPFAGVWADRYNRKVIIMVADGFIALATLGLAVSFLTGHSSLALLLAASVIRSIGGGLQTPAVSALYPQLVPKENMVQVQGMNQTLNSLLLLVSPAVGGALLGTVGIVGAFFVDVATAALAIGVMSFIKIQAVARTTAPDTVWADLKSGLSYTFMNPVLRRLIVFFSLSFFLFTPASVLTPLLVERSFGDEVWRLTANEIVWTVGMLLGGLFVSIKGQFRNKVRTVSLGLIGFGVTFSLLGVAQSFVLYLVFMGLAGCFMPAVSTALNVQIQELSSPQMMGRVFSVVHIISSSSMPLSILLFGPLADIMPIEILLIVSGLLLVVVGLAYGWPAKNATHENHP